MANKDSTSPDHLGRKDQSIYWDWGGENPVEIILVAFLLILFFTLPRTGCGIDKTHGTFPVDQQVDQPTDQQVDQPAGEVSE